MQISSRAWTQIPSLQMHQVGDLSSVPSAAPAKNPLECIAHLAGEASARARAHLARLLRLPLPQRSAQITDDSYAPRENERRGAHALASTSGQKSSGAQPDLHDSFSSAVGGSRPQGKPAGAQHFASASAISSTAKDVMPQAVPGYPGSAAAGGELAAREELGRATWTLLHTLAAQFPERPSRQQQKDARTLVSLLCHSCTAHACISFCELSRDLLFNGVSLSGQGEVVFVFLLSGKKAEWQLQLMCNTACPR